MTTDWSKTWAGANGWYDGYDSTNTGSFVDISTLSGAEREAAINSAREEMVGLLEQKGVTRAQILDPTSDVGGFYKEQMDAILKGGDDSLRDAYQSTAQHTTSATDRGNKWGADDDDTIGRTYLDSITDTASSTGAASLNEIADLYRKGFGREPDPEGLLHWASSGQSLKHIATEFGRSEEANIKDVYADEYNRDADPDGLQYWMNVSGREDDTQTDHNAYDASQLVSDSLKARGNDYEQVETSIRDSGWENLGQASNEDQRKTMPTLGDNRLFTAMENTQVVDWVNKIHKGDMELDDVIGKPQIDDAGNVVSGSGGILYNRGDYMDAHNQYDVDDWDEDGANPTGMGRFASLQEIQTAIDEGKTPDDVRTELGKKKWDSLTQEKYKELGDASTSQDLYEQARENFTSTNWRGKTPVDGPSYDQGGDWQPTVPNKGSRPPKPPVDKRQIDYLPNQPADEFSSTPYGAAKKEFDAEAGILRPQVMPQPKAQAVGQRFTGTSAKGVKMKRSKASMGTIRGTKQLSREQQTKSLNI